MRGFVGWVGFGNTWYGSHVCKNEETAGTRQRKSTANRRICKFADSSLSRTLVSIWSILEDNLSSEHSSRPAGKIVTRDRHERIPSVSRKQMWRPFGKIVDALCVYDGLTPAVVPAGCVVWWLALLSCIVLGRCWCCYLHLETTDTQ